LPLQTNKNQSRRLLGLSIKLWKQSTYYSALFYKKAFLEAGAAICARTFLKIVRWNKWKLLEKKFIHVIEYFSKKIDIVAF